MGRTMIQFLLLLLVTTQLTSDAEPQPNPSLEGIHLTVVLAHFPPVTMIERNSSGYVIGYSGSFIEQFDWLSRCLGFEYTLMPWDNSTLGPIKSNKTRNAFGEMIGQLIRKEVDVSLGPFVVRLERQDIGIGGLIGGIVNGILVRYPSSIEKSIYATIEPFSYQIWMGIGLSLLAVAACSWFILYISRRYMNLEMPVQGIAAKILVYLFKVVVQQGTNYKQITRSIGVLAFTWVLIAIVIVNAYNSSVISYLSTNYRKPEVSTFKELAENPNFNMLNLKGSAAEYDVKTGVTKILNTLAKKYERCAECSIEYNAENIANKVMNEDYVAVLTTLQALSIINQFSPNPRDCKLTLGNDQLKYYHAFFGVHRESPYQAQLRLGSLWYISHGFAMHLESSREATGTRQCLLKYNNKGGQSENVISPIKLKQLSVPFVILICGWLLAFFQFLRELMHAHFERQMMNQVNPAPTAVTTVEVVVESPPTDPDTSSHPAESSQSIIENAKPKLVCAEAPVIHVGLAVTVVESPLIVVDFSNDLDGENDEALTSRPSLLPNEIK